jgi:hypothetical protein
MQRERVEQSKRACVAYQFKHSQTNATKDHCIDTSEESVMLTAVSTATKAKQWSSSK